MLPVLYDEQVLSWGPTFQEDIIAFQYYLLSPINSRTKLSLL